LGYFLTGLQTKIRLHDPKELMRSMEVALNLEESMNEEKKKCTTYQSNTPNFRYSTGIGLKGVIGKLLLVWLATQGKTHPFLGKRIVQG